MKGFESSLKSCKKDKPYFYFVNTFFYSKPSKYRIFGSLSGDLYRVHIGLLYLLEVVDQRRQEMVFFIFNFLKGSQMKSLFFTIMLAAFSIVTSGWADSSYQPPHVIYKYVGISGSDVGFVSPIVGVKTQCEEVILDINASYILVKGLRADWHYATLSASALSSFLKNELGEVYGGFGLQVSGLFNHRHLKDNYRKLHPEFIAGIKRNISEYHFIFFQVNVHPWEIPLHSHSSGKRSGAVLFKMGISI